MRGILALVLSSLAAVAAGAGGPNALFTTDATGEPVNANRFDHRRDAYISGGPGGRGGLADGDWVFQVTDPSGRTLLSADRSACRVVRAEGGTLVALRDLAYGAFVDHKGDDGCHAGAKDRHDARPIDGRIVVQLMPYAETTNTAGVYKVWIVPLGDYLAAGGDLDRRPDGAPDPGFADRSSSKTDNFRVKSAANLPPVADAGPDRTVTVGEDAVLDGSDSFDPDGDPLTFGWKILDRPTDSAAMPDDPTAVRPTVAIDVAGSYTFELRVHDGETLSAPDLVTLDTAGSPPVADAGPDATATVGATVTLDGTGSFDPDGDPLTFAWAFVARPDASVATLDDPSSPMPSFDVDVAGSYVVELVVDDGESASAPDEVVVDTINSPPVADAGPDRSVPLDALVVLDGSGSTDADGDPLDYLWTLLNAPPGSGATLSDPGAIAPTFVADTPGDYLVQLVVDDGLVDSLPDTAVISTDNVAPVADAGPDRTASVGEVVQLDGSGSTDVDGDPLTYAWSLPTRPEGSAAALSDPAAVMPTFEVDVAGDYVAQLVVNDGELDSTIPDTVTITTTNATPTADAGADRSVLVGDVVVLDGTGSSDPEGVDLNYAWSLLSRPEYSEAALDDPAAAMPSFDVDRPGDYVVQLVVDDGENASAPDTVVVSTVGSRPVADAGDDRTVPAGTLVTLDGGGSNDADGDPLTYAWSLISIPDGSAAVLDDPASETPSFEADLPGTHVVQLIVNDGVADSDPATAVVEALAANELGLVLDDPLVAPGRTLGGRVVLGSPAPPGGVEVALTSDDPGIATIEPPSVTVAEGEVDAPVEATGVDLGTTTLRATAPDYEAAETPITVTDFLISIDNFLVVAPGETQGLAVSLSRPAPGGGVTIAFASEDGTIATVTPSVFVPAGQQIPISNPLVTGGLLGETTVVATADGFAPDARPITVSLTMAFDPDTLTLPLETRPIALRLSDPAPAGGLEVAIASDAPAVVSVPASVTVLEGEIAVDVPITGVAEGDTVVRANVPGLAEATASISVRNGILATPFALGDDLQAEWTISLEAPAGPDGTTLTLTSTDAARLIVAAAPELDGEASLTRPVAGGSSSARFWVQALDDSGSVDVVVTSPGFEPATVAIELRPSGFVCLANAFTPCDFSTNPLQPVTRFLRVLTLDPATLAPQLGGPGRLRGTLSVDVEIVSDDPTVGTATSPATFSSTTTTELEFQPAGPGTTTLTIVPPPGFETPSLGGEVEATVDELLLVLPTPQFGASSNVGRDLQRRQNLAFSANPPMPVDVTLTVDDPAVARVSTDVNEPGPGTIVVPAASAGFPFVLQGLETGTTTLTASAPGYTPAVLEFEVLPSAVGFAGSNGNPPTLDLSRLDDPRALNVLLLVEDPEKFGSPALRAQMARPGADLSVGFTIGDPAVGTVVPDPWTPAPDGLTFAFFDPQASGTTDVGLVAPAGFVPSADDAIHDAIEITVEDPTLELSGIARVGHDLQRFVTIRLSDWAEPVDVTLTVADPTVAAVSRFANQLGGAVATVPFTSASNRNFALQGIAAGTTTLEVSAPGYVPRTYDVEVGEVGFAARSPSLSSSLVLTTFDPGRTLTVEPYVLHPSTLQPQFTLPFHPGAAPVSVAVISSNPTVAEITTSPLEFAFGTNSATTTIDPVTAGESLIDVVQPPGFTEPAVAGSIALTVNAPDVRLTFTSAAGVGLDLQRAVQVRLEEAPPEPVDVTITSTAGSIVSLSLDPTVEGGDSVTFTGVTRTFVGNVWVQGLALGAVELIGQAPGFDDGTLDVDVRPSGFVHEPALPVVLSANGPDAPAKVVAVMLDPTDLGYVGVQLVRAGVVVDVVVTSDDLAVAGVLGVPLTFVGGDFEREYAIDPLAAGSTTLTVETPPGFSTPQERRTRAVEVTP